MGNWRSKHYEQDEFLQELLTILSGETTTKICYVITACCFATDNDTYLFCYLDYFISHGTTEEQGWIAKGLSQVPSTTFLASPKIPPLLIHLIKVTTHLPYKDVGKQLLQRLLDYYTIHKDTYNLQIDQDLLRHVFSILRDPPDFDHFKKIIAQLPASNTLQNLLCELALEPKYNKSVSRLLHPSRLHPARRRFSPHHLTSALSSFDGFETPEDSFEHPGSAKTTRGEKQALEFRNLSHTARYHSLNSLVPWYVSTLLLPSNHPDNYCIIEGRPEHYRQVNKLYARNPVPGYSIKSVKVIHNEHLKKQFEVRINFLGKRHNNPAFEPNWKWANMTDAEQTQRKRTLRIFEQLTYKQYQMAPHVSLLPLWHGTSSSILESLFTTGYAGLASTDGGYFGKGIYGTPDAEYAFRVYSKGALLVNWVAVFSAFPVILKDEAKLAGRGHFENYDAHFAPVYSPKHPRAKSYHACAPLEQHQYSELVVFESSQVLPHYIVELQPISPPPLNTPTSPPLDTPAPPTLTPLSPDKGLALPLSPLATTSEVLNLTEAAAYLSMTENKLLAMIEAKEITGTKTESHWQITKEELDNYCRSIEEI